MMQSRFCPPFDHPHDVGVGPLGGPVVPRTVRTLDLVTPSFSAADVLARPAWRWAPPHPRCPWNTWSAGGPWPCPASSGSTRNRQVGAAGTQGTGGGPIGRRSLSRDQTADRFRHGRTTSTVAVPRADGCRQCGLGHAPGPQTSVLRAHLGRRTPSPPEIRACGRVCGHTGGDSRAGRRGWRAPRARAGGQRHQGGDDLRRGTCPGIPRPRDGAGQFEQDRQTHDSGRCRLQHHVHQRVTQEPRGIAVRPRISAQSRAEANRSATHRRRSTAAAGPVPTRRTPPPCSSPSSAIAEPARRWSHTPPPARPPTNASTSPNNERGSRWKSIPVRTKDHPTKDTTIPTRRLARPALPGARSGRPTPVEWPRAPPPTRPR